MSNRDERDVVEVPENAMRDDPLAFGLTAPQLGLAGVAVAVAFVLNLLPLWLPLRLTLAVLVAAPVFGVAVVSIRGEPGYRWLVRFIRYVRSDKTWGAAQAQRPSGAVSDTAPRLSSALHAVQPDATASLQEGHNQREPVDTVRSAAPSVPVTPAQSADPVAAPREPRAMGEKPARLRLVAGDSDERPSSDDRPPDDVLPAPSGLPHLLRGLRLVCFVSFAGGVGKTQLAVEVASLVASAARYLTADGAEEAVRVLVLDTARFAPAAAFRLGVPPGQLSRSWTPDAWRDPEVARRYIVESRSGAGVLTLPPHPRQSGRDPLPESRDDEFLGAGAQTLLEAAQSADTSLVLADLGLALDEGHRYLIEQADLVLGVVRPTQASLPDAYRLATMVRGLRMGRKLALVANMADDDRETRAVAHDAGVEFVAAIPRHAAFEQAAEAGEPAWRRSPETRAAIMPLARIVWPFFVEANGRRHGSTALLRGLLSGGHR